MKLLKYIATLFSILFYPMLIPTYAMIFLSVAFSRLEAYNLQKAYYIILITGTLIFTCIIPLSVVLILYKQNRIKNIYIEDREERSIPYMYAVCSAAIWCFFLWHVMKIPNFIVMMSVTATIALGLVAVINRWWKISAHLSCFGALIGGVAGYCWYTSNFNLWLIPTLLGLALILMYSRLYLKAHTAMQVVCGFLLGMITTFIPAFFA